jgi:hypothetical protein
VSLVAWVKAKPNRRLEKDIASMMLGHVLVDELLTLVLERLWNKVDAFDVDAKSRIHAEWRTGKIESGKDKGQPWGAYQTYFGRSPPFDDVSRPKLCDATRKIEIIHDMMEYFSDSSITKHETAGANKLPRPRQQSYAATVHDPQLGIVRRIEGGDDREMKGKIAKGSFPDDRWLENVGTRDPDNALTRAATMHDMPVWAGNSQTTARMLEFVAWLDGSLSEFEAVAWAIFAYWRIAYDKSATPYHTFHEVMDVAFNYGVAYESFEYNAPMLAGPNVALPLRPKL